MEIPEFDQTPGDILQEQESYEIKTVPIETVICEPVRTQLLPARSGGWATFALSTSQAIQIMQRDPRRKRAIVIVADSTGQSRGATLGATQAQAQENVGFNIPLYGTNISSAFVHPPVELTSMDEVWAIADGSAACKISVMIEQWAD